MAWGRESGLAKTQRPGRAHVARRQVGEVVKAVGAEQCVLEFDFLRAK